MPRTPKTSNSLTIALTVTLLVSTIGVACSPRSKALPHAPQPQTQGPSEQTDRDANSPPELGDHPTRPASPPTSDQTPQDPENTNPEASTTPEHGSSTGASTDPLSKREAEQQHETKPQSQSAPDEGIAIEISQLTPGTIKDFFSGADLRVDLVVSATSEGESKAFWKETLGSTKTVSFSRNHPEPSKDLQTIALSRHDLARALRDITVPKGHGGRIDIRAHLVLMEADSFKDDLVIAHSMTHDTLSAEEVTAGDFQSAVASSMMSALLTSHPSADSVLDWTPVETHNSSYQVDEYEWKTKMVYGPHYDFLLEKWTMSYHPSLSYEKTGRTRTRTTSYTTGGGTQAGFRFKISRG